MDESIKYNIPRKTLSKTYKLMFYKQLMYNTINKNPILHNFSRLTQDSAVAKFKKEDKIKFEISKAEINCKLSNKKPDFTKMVAGSQQSVLTREALKKRKQKPVRELLKENNLGSRGGTLNPHIGHEALSEYRLSFPF